MIFGFICVLGVYLDCLTVLLIVPVSRNIKKKQMRSALGRKEIKWKPNKDFCLPCIYSRDS